MKTLSKLLAVMMSLAIMACVVSASPGLSAAAEDASPDMIYLDPDNCQDLVPAEGSIVKGENNGFTFTCNGPGAIWRWYFDKALSDEYPYLIVSTKSFPAGGWCMLPMWGDKTFDVNLGSVSSRIHPSMKFVVIDRRLETFEPAYNGLQIIFEGVAAGTEIEIDYIALSKVDPLETVILDPDNCQDLKPADGTIAKGENGAFTYTAPAAGGGAMRWYFSQADAETYRYIIISVKDFPAGNWCIIPQWGDKFFPEQLDNGRIFSGMDYIVLDKQAEDFSGAGYNGFQLLCEGFVEGTKIEFNYIAVSKVAEPNIPVDEQDVIPDALVFDAASEVVEVVPPAGCIKTGTKNAFNFTVAPYDAQTNWNAFRLYKDNIDLSVYKYLIISLNDLPQGEVQAVLNDVVLNNDFINYQDANKTVSIDVSAYSLTGTGALRLTLYTSGVESGQTVKYNYVAMSNVTAEELATADFDIGGGVVEADEPDDDEPGDVEPGVRVNFDFADAVVDKNVKAQATADGFTMYINPDQAFAYQNTGNVSFKVKVDLSKCKYLHIDLKSNEQAYFMCFFLDNDDGSSHLETMAYPTYILGGTNPGQMTYSLYDDILAKGEGYDFYVTGERWYTLAICMDDGGAKNAAVNTLGAIYLDNNEEWVAEEDEDKKDDDDDKTPDTGDMMAAVLPVAMMAVAGAAIISKKRRSSAR